MSSPPDITISDGQVYSSRYDDIYFNTDGGPAESEYVFLGGNDLPARWQGEKYHCITETGFGTGLNFLVTLQTWLDDPRRCESLDYYSIEAYPLARAQLEVIYTQWPAFAALSGTLIKQYPSLDHGVHTLLFETGRVRLHLVFMQLDKALEQLALDPDSWYLDGFSPAKNPSMWQTSGLQKIAACSRPGTSLATYTAASAVRRDLGEAGFETRKRRGYGPKREMLCAIKTAQQKPPAPNRLSPWFALSERRRRPRRVAIIGAGIAGAQLAWHLAQRGLRPVVIEAREQIAAGASGNPAGILAPKLTASPSEGEVFYLTAFLYQLRQLELLRAQGYPVDFARHGLLQIPHNHSSRQRIQKLGQRDDLPDDLLQGIEPQQLSALLGETVEQAGILISAAGALSPRSLCKALLEHPGIELQLATRLGEFSRRPRGLILKLSTGERLEVDALVLANGHQVTDFSAALQVTPVRGQTSRALLRQARCLNYALDHQAYLVHAPGDQQQVIFGASYLRGETDTQLRKQETSESLAALKTCLPELVQQLEAIEPAHAGVRATTVDRWPVVGPLADTDFYLEAYSDLHQGRQYKHYPPGNYQDGIYVLSGLGSRGLASAAYCANLLSHIMLGTPPPAPSRQLNQLHPARFIIRDLKKRREQKA